MGQAQCHDFGVYKLARPAGFRGNVQDNLWGVGEKVGMAVKMVRRFKRMIDWCCWWEEIGGNGELMKPIQKTTYQLISSFSHAFVELLGCGKHSDMMQEKASGSPVSGKEYHAQVRVVHAMLGRGSRDDEYLQLVIVLTLPSPASAAPVADARIAEKPRLALRETGRMTPRLLLAERCDTRDGRTLCLCSSEAEGTDECTIPIMARLSNTILKLFPERYLKVHRLPTASGY